MKINATVFLVVALGSGFICAVQGFPRANETDSIFCVKGTDALDVQKLYEDFNEAAQNITDDIGKGIKEAHLYARHILKNAIEHVRNSFIQSCHLYNININTLNKTDVCIVLVNEFYKKVQNAGKEVSLWTKSFSNDHLTLYEWQYKYLLDKFDKLLPEMDKNPNLLNTTNCEDDAPCLSKVRENRSFVRSVLLFMNEYECQKSHWDEDVKDKLKSFESFTKSSHETAKHIDACLKEKFPEPY